MRSLFTVLILMVIVVIGRGAVAAFDPDEK